MPSRQQLVAVRHKVGMALTSLNLRLVYAWWEMRMRESESAARGHR